MTVRTRPTMTTRLLKLVAAGTLVGFRTGFSAAAAAASSSSPLSPCSTRCRRPSARHLVVIAVNTATAFAARLNGSIDWAATLLFTTAAIAGVGVGTGVADRFQPADDAAVLGPTARPVAPYTGGRAAAGTW